MTTTDCPSKEYAPGTGPLAVAWREAWLAPEPASVEPKPEEQPRPSPREREVIAMIRIGYSNREIGVALGIGRSGVKRHLENLFRKFDVANRTELIGLFTHPGHVATGQLAIYPKS